MISINRNEWKYNINRKSFISILTKLDMLLDKDKHCDTDGKYFIRSLYFDSKDKICVFDNESGYDIRYKYRIRCYGNDDSIFLEKKLKKHDKCHKITKKISKEIYQNIIDKNVDDLLYSDNELLREFAYKLLFEEFEPSLIVEYNRYAFLENISNTRITLDTDAVVSKDFEHFLDNSYFKTDLFDDGRIILEVKFDNELYKPFIDAIDLHELTRISNSKYYLGYMRMENKI